MTNLENGIPGIKQMNNTPELDIDTIFNKGEIGGFLEIVKFLEKEEVVGLIKKVEAKTIEEYQNRNEILTLLEQRLTELNDGWVGYDENRFGPKAA